jgi:hypothetical protein
MGRKDRAMRVGLMMPASIADLPPRRIIYVVDLAEAAEDRLLQP